MQLILITEQLPATSDFIIIKVWVILWMCNKIELLVSLLPEIEQNFGASPAALWKSNILHLASLLYNVKYF